MITFFQKSAKKTYSVANKMRLGLDAAGLIKLFILLRCCYRCEISTGNLTNSQPLQSSTSIVCFFVSVCPIMTQSTVTLLRFVGTVFFSNIKEVIPEVLLQPEKSSAPKFV